MLPRPHTTFDKQINKYTKKSSYPPSTFLSSFYVIYMIKSVCILLYVLTLEKCQPSMEKRCDLKASFLKLGKEKLICLVYGLTKGLLQKLKSVEIIDIHAKKIVVLIFFELKLPIKKSQKLFSKKAFVNISDYYQLYTTHIFL